MKRLLLIFAFSLICLCASAQQFAYDTKFDYIFMNGEFDRSHNIFEKSGTLHAVRLTPSIGIDWNQGTRASHSVRLGINLFKNMGEGLPVGDIFHEAVIYYRADVPVSSGTFSAIAGVFPRTFSESVYSDAFFSDDVLYLDNNFEGMFFKYKTPHFYAELGLDWCGMKGLTRREAFRIMSSGKVDLFGTDLFKFGWAASMFHYAGSQTVRGVVDNTLVNPYLTADFSSAVGMQTLSLKVGPLIGYQWDRVYDEDTHMPWGLEAVFIAKKWDFGIENIFYRGDDLYYYYDKYGGDVYYGDPFYSWPWEGKSWMNKFAFFYQPSISDYVSLRVAIELFFGQKDDNCPVLYRGTNQIASLIIDLEHLLRKQ
ncbi:MAG: hypothetical protein J6X64_04935 [Bacteroidales bacterium]|nr:hypothetical protein [Bacteroidales bacterium]